MGDEDKILEHYLVKKNLRMSKQRREVLQLFLRTERHLSTEELYLLAKKKDPLIGYSTVYRMMKILCECGLARELDLGDGRARFEHSYGHEHHDHLVCIQCGKFVEVFSPKIEALQKHLARRHKFKSRRHRLQIFGLCEICQKK